MYFCQGWFCVRFGICSRDDLFTLKCSLLMFIVLDEMSAWRINCSNILSMGTVSIMPHENKNSAPKNCSFMISNVLVANNVNERIE